MMDNSFWTPSTIHIQLWSKAKRSKGFTLDLRFLKHVKVKIEFCWQSWRLILFLWCTTFLLRKEKVRLQLLLSHIHTRGVLISVYHVHFVFNWEILVLCCLRFSTGMELLYVWTLIWVLSITLFSLIRNFYN